MAPTVAKRWVTRAVLAPIRADALAASQPAWPPPMTMTSNDSGVPVMATTSIAGWQGPKDVSRETGVIRLFHVKHSVNHNR
jgi:hypothetical protein